MDWFGRSNSSSLLRSFRALFFRLFGLRFCTSNSSSLLRFVAFVILVEFLGAFALCGRPLLELKNGPVFQLRGALLHHVEFLIPFALGSRLSNSSSHLRSFRFVHENIAQKHLKKEFKTTIDERSHRVNPVCSKCQTPAPVDRC